jgi:hypothetical protein
MPGRCGGFDMIDEQPQVTTADVARAGRRHALARSLVLGRFQVGRQTQTYQGDLGDRPYMNVEFAPHPVVLAGQRRQPVDDFSAEYVNQEPGGDIQIKHCESYMINPARARHFPRNIPSRFMAHHCPSLS